jgi:hypothetical protein
MVSKCRLLSAPEDYKLVGTLFDIFHHRLRETSRYYSSSKVRDHIERYTPHFQEVNILKDLAGKNRILQAVKMKPIQ